MKKSNWCLLGAFILISAIPFWWVAPLALDPSLENAQLFSGADAKASELILKISPEYKTWFSPVYEPQSSEIATLLFALQAAIGAGVLGYWLGSSVARDKHRKELAGAQPTEVHHRVD